MAAKRLDTETVEIKEENKNSPEFLTETRFNQLNLPPVVMKGIEDAGFSFCSPIQEQVLPLTLEGKDIAGQAQTGTGKTAAFLVTLFARMQKLKVPKGKTPSALVIAPTRELASQIMEEAKVLGGHTGYRIIQIIGGIDYEKQAKQLRDGVDIVICTPGRVIDYMKQNVFKTSTIKLLVIDEADRLLDMGFEKDMRFILKRLPKYDRRQSMLFSATLSYRVMELTYEYMNLPEFVAVAPEKVTVKGIDQVLYHVGMDEKLPLLLGILKREKWHRMLIFVNTKVGVEWLAQKLKKNGWPAEGITGDLQQNKRFRLMEQFKSGKLKILIATDVASRGLHVDDISHVINYDLPQDAENYVHRIGRTARAGTTGRAISLACERYIYHLEPIETVLTDKIPVEGTDESLFEKDTAGPVKVASSRPSRTSRPSSPKPHPQRSSGRPPKNGRQPNARKTSRYPDGDIIRQRLKKGYFPGTFFGLLPTTKTDTDKKGTATALPKHPKPGKKTPSQSPTRALKNQKQTPRQKQEKKASAQKPVQKAKGQESQKSSDTQKLEKKTNVQRPKRNLKAQKSQQNPKPQKNTEAHKSEKKTNVQRPKRNLRAQNSEQNPKDPKPQKNIEAKKPDKKTNVQRPKRNLKAQKPEQNPKDPKPQKNTEAKKPDKKTNVQRPKRNLKAQKPEQKPKDPKPQKNTAAQEPEKKTSVQRPKRNLKAQKSAQKPKDPKPQKNTGAQKPKRNTKAQKTEKNTDTQDAGTPEKISRPARRGRPRKKPPTKSE